MHHESTQQSLPQHVVLLTRPDLVNGIVAGDVESLVVQVHGPTFDLTVTSPLVGPELEVVTQTLTLHVEVIEKHSWFT